VIITLWGGPRDGVSFRIADVVWRSGVVMVPIPGHPYWFSDLGDGLRAAVYVCRRWIPEWAGPCAMPLYRWTFDHEERV
jgi:hypothetical protein